MPALTHFTAANQGETSVSPLEQSGPSKKKFSRTKTAIYQILSDSINAALEADVKP